MVVRRRLDPPQLQDGRLAHHADARERHRLHRRSRVPPPRSRRHVGSSDREAPEPRGRRNHGQRLRAGEAARGVGAVAAEGRRARGDAEQVRAVGRPAVTSAPADAGPQRVLFVTGKLAEPALRRTLTDMAPAFAHEVAVMKITVAALMTTPWIARFLDVPAGTDLVLIPGLCEGDVAVIAEKVGTRVEKGPKDLRQIPEYFGRAAATRAYGASDIEIVAEVNNAPRLAREALRREAEHYRAHGADIIDVGCTPGREFPELAGVVRELVGGGMRVSIDSFDPSEIRTAVAAGAELVLSVNRSNLDVARDFARTKTRVVVIPDFGQGIETLEPSVEALEQWGVSYLIDPVVEPIGFGFFASLERFAAVRRRHDGSERPPDRHLSGAGRAGSPHHRGDPLGPRRGARSGPRAPSHVPRRHPEDASQGRGRPARHAQGSHDPGLRRSRAARAAGARDRSQLPHLRRPRGDHRFQPRDLPARNGYPRDLRGARRGRGEPRLLPRP